MNKLFLFFIFLLFFSCSHEEKIPRNILTPQKMQLVFWDYLRADAYCSRVMKSDSTNNDSSMNANFQIIIFNHHKISKEDFFRSYNYYIAHPELMTPILDSMVAQKSKTDYGNLFKERLRLLEK
jgi:hypothetical protein